MTIRADPPTVEKVTAYRIFEEDGGARGRFVTLDLDELDPGEVVVRVAFSSVNFKDALAASSNGKIIRRFPCIGGIDVSGTVCQSADRRFQEGDEVLATSYGLGVSHDGGYATYCRLPAAWVVALPENLSLWEAMALGTAGYTVGLAVTRMERLDVRPSDGPIVVSGATGGVGSLAIDILTSRGYSVTAVTGKSDQVNYLKTLGATDVTLRESLDLSQIKPLGKAIWAGAIDTLGGGVFSWMASTMRPGGVLTLIGLAADARIETTVMPWILRGVTLIGISSTDTAMGEREQVWRALSGDLRPRHLHGIAKTVPFEKLPQVFESLLAGKAVGRTVVKLGDEYAEASHG